MVRRKQTYIYNGNYKPMRGRACNIVSWSTNGKIFGMELSPEYKDVVIRLGVVVVFPAFGNEMLYTKRKNLILKER